MDKNKAPEKPVSKKTEKYKLKQQRLAKSARVLEAHARVVNKKAREEKERIARIKRHQEIAEKTSLKARYAAMDAKYGTVEQEKSPNVPEHVQEFINDIPDSHNKDVVQDMANNAFADNRR